LERFCSERCKGDLGLGKKKFEELDLQKHETGNELDELNAHRFLEHIKGTMTAVEMRDYIRSVGVDKVKYVPLAHYLLARYKANLKKLVNASQGDNQDEIIKAQQMLEVAQDSLTNATTRSKEATTAETELKTALAELHSQEETFNNRTQDLKKNQKKGLLFHKTKQKQN